MGSEIEKIAVIGMACRYPGADNIDEYWNNLLSGKETIKRFNNDELKDYEIDFDELKKNPKYIPARGILNDIDKFDAGFFGFSPNEAKHTDPQHRLWLETVWDAFENAGCDPFKYNGAVGVYTGSYTNTYLINNILRDPKKLENYIRLRNAESYQLMTSNNSAYIPTKTAFTFNLKGPAINVQTACSTSLVAISQACNSLFVYESDICVAGGVCILTPQQSGYIYQEGSIPSPDGHCRPFDAEANGTVFSNGVGVVILKRLEDAIKDKDNIYAVINGWALNNDGNKKVSFTAPSIDGQAEAILMAQDFNNTSAENISYIEAHGTATNLGDAIEVAALSKAFDQSTQKKQFCGIGSVKSNLGHTDTASGVASFIKLCLSAYHKVIPPTLNFKNPNPNIDFENSPFYVLDKKLKWESDNKLIMGVSSFGMGGTNSHVIVEEPPQRKNEQLSPKKKNYIIPLSAKTDSALETRKSQLIEFVKNNPDTNIDNLCFTLWNGRSYMKHRAVTVVNSLEELKSDALKFDHKISEENISSIAFMFPGEESHYFSMGYEFYKVNGYFRALVDEGLSIYKQETGINLKEILFGLEDSEESEIKFSEASIDQPALFIIEYSLAKTLIENKIKPKYLIGHGIGEYTAACIAGVFDYSTGLKIVIKRGQLIQSTQSGNMLAALCSKQKLIDIGDPTYEIAAENGPNNCTISFEPEYHKQIAQKLDENHIACIPLNTSYAFNSKAFDPILNEFESYINTFELKSPSLPFISCYTGEFILDNQATSGEYWAKQLRNTILFYKGIKTILSNEQVFFIEVGPNSHLISMLKVIPEFKTKKATVTTFVKRDVYTESLMLEKVQGNIWAGMEFTPDLSIIDDNTKKIPLPTYPYEKQRYWIDYKASEGYSKADDHVKIEGDNNVSDLQKSIINVWKDYLSIQNINPNDDFFKISGNTSIAISIADKINEMYGISFDLRKFINNPTVIDIAQYIEIYNSSSKAEVPITDDNLGNKTITGEI